MVYLLATDCLLSKFIRLNNLCILLYNNVIFSVPGSWKADEQHGYGKFFGKTTGHEVSGTWVNGRLTGEGKFIGSSGPVYAGHGKLVPSLGDVYEGTFRDNKKHGYGKCQYSKTFGQYKGQVYEGEWVDDVRHGKQSVSQPL
jgi:hypothetical protein